MSHPPLEVREAEFGERAAVWWQRHAGDRRYIGQRNLFERKALDALDFRSEWAGGAGQDR